jgi:hypothetical protein
MEPIPDSSMPRKYNIPQKRAPIMAKMYKEELSYYTPEEVGKNVPVSGMMNPILPNDYGLLLLHITAHVNHGTATVRYAVWDIANPAIKDTLTYILNIPVASSIAEAEIKSALSIFPNPANNVINFSNDTNAVVSLVEMTDMNGRVIKSAKINATEGEISVSDLSSGVYMMRITTDQGNATKKIVKQ